MTIRGEYNPGAEMVFLYDDLWMQRIFFQNWFMSYFDWTHVPI